MTDTLLNSDVSHSAQQDRKSVFLYFFGRGEAGGKLCDLLQGIREEIFVIVTLITEILFLLPFFSDSNLFARWRKRAAARRAAGEIEKTENH